MKLSREDFGRARDYLMAHGRPLEQSLFRHCFENGPASEALGALRAHQAPEGGFFGMGEGPIDAPSPIGSVVAFEHLTDLKAPSSEPLVQNGIRYFIETYDRGYAVWPEQVPDAGYLANNLPLHWGNPSAEIVGFLWFYRDLVPAGFLTEVTDLAMTNFRLVGDDLASCAGQCFLRCAEFLPQPYRDEILDAMIGGIARRSIECDYTKWDSEYFFKPYWYAMTPASPLYPVLREEVDRCLDFDIRTQEPDGSAWLTFSAGGESRRIWKSVWTLESLRALKAYGRIERRTEC